MWLVFQLCGRMRLDASMGCICFVAQGDMDYVWVITLSRPEGGSDIEQIEWGVVIGQDGLVEGVLPLGSFCMCPPHETNLIFLHSQTTQ